MGLYGHYTYFILSVRQILRYIVGPRSERVTTKVTKKVKSIRALLAYLTQFRCFADSGVLCQPGQPAVVD